MSNLSLKAMLLAAGFGTRLKPLTNEIPKCLVPIGKCPLLEYWLQLLENNNIPALINTHYLPQQVEEFIYHRTSLEKFELIYEKQLFGTAGSLVKNQNYYKDSQILLIHADNLSIFNLKELIEAHQKRPPQCEITMLSFNSDTPSLCGILKLNELGIVTSFHEKEKNPPGNLANGAVYILEPTVLEHMLTLNKPILDFSTEVIPAYLGKILSFENKIYHRDIGSIESLSQANYDIIHHQKLRDGVLKYLPKIGKSF